MALSIEKQKKIIDELVSRGGWSDSDALSEALGECKYKIRTWLAALLAECTVPGWLVVSRQGPRLAEYKAVRDPNLIYASILKSPVPVKLGVLQWVNDKTV